MGNKATDIILEDRSFETINNKLDLLFNTTPVLTITGDMATGKTTFAAQFILKKFKYRKVGVVESNKHLSPLLIEGGMPFITVVDDFERLQEKDLDLIIVEDFQRYLDDTERIKNLITGWTHKGIKIILISQQISPTLIEDHISVNLKLLGDDVITRKVIEVENIIDQETESILRLLSE